MSPIPIDYSDGDIELYPYFEDEYDEWGNRIDWIDGFQFVDLDKQVEQERDFERHIKNLSKKSGRDKVEAKNEPEYTFVHKGYYVNSDGRLAQRIERILARG